MSNESTDRSALSAQPAEGGGTEQLTEDVFRAREACRLDVKEQLDGINNTCTLLLYAPDNLEQQKELRKQLRVLARTFGIPTKGED